MAKNIFDALADMFTTLFDSQSRNEQCERLKELYRQYRVSTNYPEDYIEWIVRTAAMPGGEYVATHKVQTPKFRRFNLNGLAQLYSRRKMAARGSKSLRTTKCGGNNDAS